MKYIKYKENSGKYNMEYDSILLDYAVKTKEKGVIIRFYGWNPPCVSLGRNQSAENINSAYCIENKIDIVKRVTGGRGLLHDDEVTYSFICPVTMLEHGESIIQSYKEISYAIIKGFSHLDIQLELGGKKPIEASHDYCMLLSTGADLSYNGKKLIGSAQYRTQGYILQHGSVLFSYKKEVIENIFNEKTPANSITCMQEINKDITRQDVINAMTRGFNDCFD
ncbi:lipoate--protein ligase family protein [bacterium]|nr:lipoate--protein ligase family protein [bacterium]